MPKVNQRQPGGKPKPPKKPYKSFPLFPHANGQWCKKVANKHRFFGVWADPDAALRDYKRRLENGGFDTPTDPRPKAGDATIADVCNAFLKHKEQLVDSGELPQDVRPIPGSHGPACRPIRQATARRGPPSRRLPSLAGQDGEAMGSHRTGERNPDDPVHLPVRLRIATARQAPPVRPGVQETIREDAADYPSGQRTQAVHP